MFQHAILMAAYLGGAIFTHLRVGDPWWFPIIIGILAWLGQPLRQPLRQPLIFALASVVTTEAVLCLVV
jgi:hypothetical protein